MTEQTGSSDIKKNMKEATALLNVLDLNDKKLATILSKLSETVKQNPVLQELIENLAKKNPVDENSIDFDHLNQMMGTEEMMPMITSILNEMSQNPDIINHFEKEILPILFTR